MDPRDTPGRPVASPHPSLSRLDVVAIIVGLVIGAGIFKAPAIVAANVGSEWSLLAVWAIGGAVSLAGALCYAELASAYPSAGGEYHFLTRAYGRRVAFLFAWSRLAILQTGSIALLAFVLGDYLAQLAPLDGYGAALYAAVSVIALTGLNIIGLRTSTTLQNVMTVVTLAGLLFVVVAGLGHAPVQAPSSEPVPASGDAAFGLAMVFVLLTFGGWNESAYVSAELRDVRRNMVRVLVTSLGVITLVYLLVNVAYLNVLGLEGMRGSEVVTADVMRYAAGDLGAGLVSALIAVAVAASINVSILTGARTNYAMANDFPLLGFLAGWSGTANAPKNALLVQGAIALALVAVGATARSGFETMVSYVSPIFWFFFLLATVSLFVLRRREPRHPRPFRVPFYPFTPLLFTLTCAYMLYSSLAYTGFGALLGVAVLGMGVPLLYFVNRAPSGDSAAASGDKEVPHAIGTRAAVRAGNPARPRG
ncbi:amino acid permease [Sulfurifustis variabilis]|uniref:Amino acid permease n=1 Tax=Sulfurifustis variabilis TaxID=1675686 RepID=A0A1B4V2J6_9GAMM|nr:amino acid permease [Sulfurifustis variabilis]BAU47753.1 amino acid permease [Sulfurifustis variabilis]